MIKINTPLDPKIINKLKCGQQVLLDGTIYTARDQAYKRLAQEIKSRRKLSLDLKNKVIYYCGPTKTPKGKVIGSCGPTTSSRMDEFTLSLLKAGLKGMIGKGSRSKEVSDAIKKYKAIYFITYAGCAALLTKYVLSAKPVAYKNLGPEAIVELKVKDFPLIVAIDSMGRSIYASK